MAQQATDSFVIDIDGAPIAVAKGEVLAEGHPILRRLGETHLFRKLEEDTPPPAPKRPVKVKTSG